jgi:hypothetical protein
VGGEPAVRKPWHLWVLQAIVAVQVVWSLVHIVPVMAGIGARLREPAALLLMLETFAAWAVAIALVVSLQRGFRRSDIIAPVAGLFWWVNGLLRAISSLGAPPPPDLERVTFDGVPPVSQVLGMLTVHALLLWLVATLLWHEKSRAYLTGALPGAASPSKPAGAA